MFRDEKPYTKPNHWPNKYDGSPQQYPEHEMRGENQRTVGAWARHTILDDDDKTPVFALCSLSDSVRLCLAAGASWQDIYKIVDNERGGSPKFAESLPDHASVPEIADDAAIWLMVLADRWAFDLHREVGKIMARRRRGESLPRAVKAKEVAGG